MKKHTEAYVATVLCAVAAVGFITSKFHWLQCAFSVFATLFGLVTALDLHQQHRDRLRGRG